MLSRAGVREDNNVTEKELEDLICKDLSVIEGDFLFVGRQISLPHGILDILAIRNCFTHAEVAVIELKLGKLKERHVGQTLRYMFDVDWMLYERTKQKLPVKGIIICSEIEPKIYAAAKAANIDVMTYDIEDGEVCVCDTGILYNVAAVCGITVKTQYGFPEWVDRTLLKYAKTVNLYTNIGVG